MKSVTWNFGRKKLLKKILKKMEKDQYCTVTLCVSFIAVLIDYFIVKRFVDIIKLI